MVNNSSLKIWSYQAEWHQVIHVVDQTLWDENFVVVDMIG